MRIAQFLPTSFQDDEKGLSSVVFTAGCNYKCPACHAKKINRAEDFYETDKVLGWLRRRRKAVGKVVLLGGEPTIQFDLKFFLRDLKKLGLKVKLDTNGSDYVRLGEYLEEGLVDYVAMDVKGPFHLYPALTGQEFVDERDRFIKPMSVVSRDWRPGYQYEFRTTVVPILRPDGRITWMTPEETEEMARQIAMNSVQERDTVHYLQPFVARDGEEMQNSRFSKQQLPLEMHETPKDLMQAVYESVRKHLPNTKIR